MPGAGAIPPVAAHPADGRAGQALRAARGLEGLLIRQMLVAMERAQLEHGLFGSGPGSGTMATTFELLVSEALARRAPLGLARQIADQLAGAPGRSARVADLAGPSPAELAPPAVRQGLNAYGSSRYGGSSSSAIGRKDRWTPADLPEAPDGGGEKE